jgi:hypothetical protein
VAAEQPTGFELLIGPGHGGPAHAQVGGQGPLGRKALTDAQAAGPDAVLDGVDELEVKRFGRVGVGRGDRGHFRLAMAGHWHLQ